MLEFYNAFLSFSFLQNALIMAILSSVLFGILGSIITVRRITSLAGAISHAVLGGIGISIYLKQSKILPNISPLLGAIIFALLTAVIIAFISLKVKHREDMVINALWAIGMSIGIIFIAKSPGYTDPSSYLFGNILLISYNDLFWLILLDIITIIFIFIFYEQIKISSYDEEYAKTKGINTTFIFISILVLISLAIVLLQNFVGVVLLIALLTIPAGIAGFLAKSLLQLMIYSSLISMFCSVYGLYLSWMWNLPSGALIVIVAGITFLIFTLFKIIIK